MESVPLLDRTGRRRSPATLSSFHVGRPLRNRGRRYPSDPPTVEEIIAVMRAAGATPDGLRLRGVIVTLWRAGLRISEALALAETFVAPQICCDVTTTSGRRLRRPRRRLPPQPVGHGVGLLFADPTPVMLEKVELPLNVREAEKQRAPPWLPLQAAGYLKGVAGPARRIASISVARCRL
jgi:hypothetical protein